MRKYRKLYIIIVVAYAALLVVSRIYSVSSFLVFTTDYYSIFYR